MSHQTETRVEPSKEAKGVLSDLANVANLIRDNFLTPFELKLLLMSGAAGSLVVVGCALTFDKHEYFKKVHIAVVGFIWFWLVLSAVIYAILRATHGKIDFRRVVHEVFGVVPLALLAGVFAAATAAVFVRLFDNVSWNFIIPTGVMLATQSVLIVVLLPARLKYAFDLGRVATAATYLVPVVMLAGNISHAIPQYKQWMLDHAKSSVTTPASTTFLPLWQDVSGKIAFLPLWQEDPSVSGKRPMIVPRLNRAVG